MKSTYGLRAIWQILCQGSEIATVLGHGQRVRLGDVELFSAAGNFPVYSRGSVARTVAGFVGGQLKRNVEKTDNTGLLKLRAIKRSAYLGFCRRSGQIVRKNRWTARSPRLFGPWGLKPSERAQSCVRLRAGHKELVKK